MLNKRLSPGLAQHRFLALPRPSGGYPLCTA